MTREEFFLKWNCCCLVEEDNDALKRDLDALLEAVRAEERKMCVKFIGTAAHRIPERYLTMPANEALFSFLLDLCQRLLEEQK